MLFPSNFPLERDQFMVPEIKVSSGCKHQEARTVVLSIALILFFVVLSAHLFYGFLFFVLAPQYPLNRMSSFQTIISMLIISY